MFSGKNIAAGRSHVVRELLKETEKPMNTSRVLLTAQELSATIEALADKLAARHGGASNLALVGIQRRGVDIAARIAALMEKKHGHKVLFGTLDITLYRDDWTTLSQKPNVRKTHIPFDVAQKHLVLVDDVLYTGRTIRCALEALSDFGRPDKVELLVLVDRGHRELPIHADYVGLTVETGADDSVDVLMQERDGKDEVLLVSN